MSRLNLIVELLQSLLQETQNFQEMLRLGFSYIILIFTINTAILATLLIKIVRNR